MADHNLRLTPKAARPVAADFDALVARIDALVRRDCPVRDREAVQLLIVEWDNDGVLREKVEAIEKSAAQVISRRVPAAATWIEDDMSEAKQITSRLAPLLRAAAAWSRRYDEPESEVAFNQALTATQKGKIGRFLRELLRLGTLVPGSRARGNPAQRRHGKLTKA